jgi:hypothetical protein
VLYNIFSLFVYMQSHYREHMHEFLFSVYFHVRAHTHFYECIIFYFRLDISAFNFMLWNFWTQESSDGMSQELYFGHIITYTVLF